MATQEQVIKELYKYLSDVQIYSINAKQIRIDISKNNVDLRKKVTADVIRLFKDSYVDTARPFDVLIPGGFKALVKPAKGAKKTGSGAFYGFLEKIDLSEYDLSEFRTVSTEFASGTLVGNIKEASDVKSVTDLNEAIVKASKNMEGITLKIHGFTFEGVIGCVPVTNGEPKADVVLVCKKNNKLYPDCYMSYKMGRAAKDFQNYSGLSEKSAKYIFDHPETYEFYKMLDNMSKSGTKADVFQPIKDKKIIGMSVWGMDYGKGAFGINNCHFIAQGEVRLSGSSLVYTHSHKNGDFNFDKQYQPVFGARFATGRNNKGPKGLMAENFRIGIFPRAYRTAWLS